jgi:hypothetical protein
MTKYNATTTAKGKFFFLFLLLIMYLFHFSCPWCFVVELSAFTSNHHRTHWHAQDPMKEPLGPSKNQLVKRCGEKHKCPLRGCVMGGSDHERPPKVKLSLRRLGLKPLAVKPSTMKDLVPLRMIRMNLVLTKTLCRLITQTMNHKRLR